jgi:hypothetical protein
MPHDVLQHAILLGERREAQKAIEEDRRDVKGFGQAKGEQFDRTSRRSRSDNPTASRFCLASARSRRRSRRR